MSGDRQGRRLAPAALLSAALALGGCSSSVVDLPSLTPSDAPARPKEPGAYLPVHDIPPDRDGVAITPEQRAKIESELMAARDRQASSKETGGR
ncbi:MAG: hypothetical protein HY852_07520 [Bradyrhizobium sp.]|uniref:hypothetical protein n=1 Tax=Bradyrhizobium sp. TaxID=376 RepID=UPI0025C56D38|nr:hypothetical protein [Bradyrhizobium sp.]MBI5261651.1 hypothetical protein [Bradyrhizobium sp.]